MKESPFSVYDFLGYLIPGSFFVYGCYIIYLFGKYDFLINENFFKKIISLKDFEIDQIFFFVLISYILGHLLSFISSITIEKYSVWTLGHPSRYLLNLNIDEYYLKNKSGARLIFRIVCWLLLLPLTLLELFLFFLPTMKNLFKKCLDEVMTEEIIIRIEKILDRQGFGPIEKIIKIDENFDFFRIIYHYSLEKRANHYSKIQNYIALYGFSRTITLIFISFFWFLLIIGFQTGFSRNMTHILCFNLLFIYLMYSNFNKLYRKFTLEVIMAAVIKK